MKKTSIIIFGCLLLVTNLLFSQRKQRVENLPTFDDRLIHFGFYLGLNQNDFKVSYKESSYPNANIEVTAQIGFNVGLITDFRLHKNINLRLEPGLVSNSKTIAFTHLLGKRDSIRELSSTFLHIPLLLKLSTDRYKNIRPFVLGGFSYDYNFSSNQNNIDDNEEGEFRTYTNNFMYEIGIGIEIYLSYFKFTPSIRGIFALNNELKYDDNSSSKWTSPIDYLGTRGLFLNFTFE